jgi:hypothetical protein
MFALLMDPARALGVKPERQAIMDLVQKRSALLEKVRNAN